jgi:hypothetical protein
MGKIGYAVAADVAAYPGLGLGWYMLNDLDHFKDAPTTGTVTSSGGHALFTKTNHGRTTGDPLDIDSGVYAGHYTIDRIDANTFKIRAIVGGALINWISNTSVTYYPIVENGFYIAQTGSHDEKNFSLGDDYAGTYGPDNHRSDGKNKYVHGDDGTTYAGPIGRHVAWIFPDHAGATVTNSGGKALLTYAAGHNIKRGMYGKIKFSSNYDGYYYLEAVVASGVRSNTQFRLRPNAVSDFVDYVADETVTWAIVPGASQMSGLDWKNSDQDDPGLVVSLASAQGQINMRKSPESVANYCFEMWGGAENIKISGAYNPVSGYGSILYRGWQDGYAFSRGRWGCYFEHGNQLTNNSIVYFSEGNGIWYDDFEIEGYDRGFAGFMGKNDALNNPTMRIKLTNFYIHNVGFGEGIYAGETTVQSGASPNTSHGIHLTLSNGVCAYTGSELFQLGQLVAGSRAKNFVGFCGSGERFNPFTTGQGQGAQFRNQEGDVEISNFVIDGYNFYGIYMQSDHGSLKTPGGTIELSNFALAHGSSGLGVFYDGNNDETLTYSFKDFYMKYIDRLNESAMYEAQASDSANLFLTVSDNPIIINNGKIDSALVSYLLYDGTAANLNLPKITRGASQPDIDYEKSGWAWHDPRKITLFVDTWDAANFYIVDLRGQRIPYQPGQVFRHKGRFYYLEESLGDLGSITNSGGHALITCQEYIADVLTTKNHGLETGDPVIIDAGTYAGTYTCEKINDTTFKIRNAGVLVNYISNKQISYAFSASAEPDQDLSKYTVLTWDATGTCIKEGSHNAGIDQYTFPPDDFRLLSGSEMARQGIGLFNIQADIDRSRIDWEFAYNDGTDNPYTSEIQTIQIEEKRDHAVADLVAAVGSGNFVRRKATPVNVGGDVGATRTESFVQVT